MFCVAEAFIQQFGNICRLVLILEENVMRFERCFGHREAGGVAPVVDLVVTGVGDDEGV